VSSTVEWVETTGKTTEEAKEAALDQLGVDEQDAEFEVVEEPRSGLFGRTRGVARVRARVLPRSPRPKPERRRRGKSSGERSESSDRPGGGSDATGDDGAKPAARSNRARKVSGGTSETSGRGGGPSRSGERSGNNGGRGSDRTSSGSGRNPEPSKEREVMESAEQCAAVEAFMTGLSEAFGLPTTVATNLDEDGVLHVDVDGSEVGLLIGPRLGTLDSIQEICRNVLQRQADGREHGKVVVDVSNVREMRRTALATFVTEAAETVKA
jgi:spoIIIJ-associated protein